DRFFQCPFGIAEVTHQQSRMAEWLAGEQLQIALLLQVAHLQSVAEQPQIQRRDHGKTSFLEHPGTLRKARRAGHATSGDGPALRLPCRTNREALMEFLLYLALGAVAGVLAGLFGVGGGLVIVPVLVFSFAAQGMDASVLTHLA